MVEIEKKEKNILSGVEATEGLSFPGKDSEKPVSWRLLGAQIRMGKLTVSAPPLSDCSDTLGTRLDSTRGPERRVSVTVFCRLGLSPVPPSPEHPSLWNRVFLYLHSPVYRALHSPTCPRKLEAH